MSPPPSAEAAAGVASGCPMDVRPAAPGTALVAAAVLAQGAVLAWRGAAAAVVPLTVVAAALCSLAWEWRGRIAHLDVVVATFAFGGGGMLAGTWLAGATSPPMHAGMAHAAAAPGTWVAAPAVMLLACAAACRWSCAPLCGGSRVRRVAAHLLAAAGMVGGMAAGGALLAPALAPLAGPVAGMHLAMVLGMSGGVAAVLPVAARERRAAGA